MVALRHSLARRRIYNTIRFPLDLHSTTAKRTNSIVMNVTWLRCVVNIGIYWLRCTALCEQSRCVCGCVRSPKHKKKSANTLCFVYCSPSKSTQRPVTRAMVPAITPSVHNHGDKFPFCISNRYVDERKCKLISFFFWLQILLIVCVCVRASFVLCGV